MGRRKSGKAAALEAQLPAAFDGEWRPKAKFGVYGEEMIEKRVKSSGNYGRVYLPQEWVGKNVKIILID